jgi:hypothetical protein
MKVSLQKTKTFSIDDSSMGEDSGRLIVWWYGPVTKNPRAQSVPKAIVFFRRLDEEGNLGQIVRRETALTHLGLLRIGSIWNKGVSNSRIELLTEMFDVSFFIDGWKTGSPYNIVHNEKRKNPIPSNEYPLYFSPDKNNLLDFSLPDGRNLLIPCTEFFVRCYGRSTESRRILATYRWEEVQRRLFKPIEEPVLPNTWPIKLASRLYNDDVVFLAHVLYDSYARRAAKNVYGQIESAYKDNAAYVFLEATPWFQSTARLFVAGIPINGGKTFLGLRILGCSDPGGKTILRDREKATLKSDSADADSNGAKERGYPVQKLCQLPDIVNLTDDEEPDHGASSQQIEEESFVVLGEPRKVIDVRRAKRNESTARNVIKGDETLFSTGEAYGSGKGVGYASIHSASVMESQGVLRDMWNAILHFQIIIPGSIQTVEWFTFEDGFSSTLEPKLIMLEEFSDEDLFLENETRKWLYSDVRSGTPRGILVIRITTPLNTIYIFEIQRRLYKSKNKDGTPTIKEEHLTGLVFILDDTKRFSQWVRHFLAQVRHVKGVIQRLTGECPGVAHAFKHTKASDEQVPCEAAVRNALGKFGIIS